MQRDDVAAVLAAVLGMLELLAELTAKVDALSVEFGRARRELPPIFLTVPEAAGRLGVSISRLRRRIRAGQVPVRRVGRSVRVDLGATRGIDDVTVAGQARQARSEPASEVSRKRAAGKTIWRQRRNRKASVAGKTPPRKDAVREAP